MTRLGRFLRRFHRDDEAQISFLAVAGVVCFVSLMSMVVNTDGLVSERIRVQNVADATVLSAASWTARGLNMEAYVNVLNTKLIATAVLINALKDSIPVMKAVGQIQQAIFQACSGVPFVGVFCAAMATVVTIQLRALDALGKLVDQLNSSLTACGKQLWKFMTGLEKLGNAVRVSFPAIGIAESISIASANGTTGIVLNGTLLSADALTLPVKATQFQDFCGPLRNGGPGYELQGYAVGTGPLTLGKDRIKKWLLLPFINFFSWPIFSGMVSAHTLQVGCQPDPNDDSDVPVKLKDLAECNEYRVTSRWVQVWSRTRPITDGSLRVEDFVPWKPLKAQVNTGNKALDEGEINDQLGNINLPPGTEPSGDDQPTLPMGDAYQYLDSTTEKKFDLVKAECQGSAAGIPRYSPPFGDNWDINRNGDTELCFYYPLTQNCRRVDAWGKFAWYNPGPTGHVRDGAPKSIGGYFIRMTREETDPETEDGPTRYIYAIETVSLVDAGTKEMSQKDFEEYLKKNGQKDASTSASDSSSCSNKPKPWMLDKNDKFEKRLQFIGLVYESIDDHPLFWNRFFTESPPRLVAYSQAQVYNYLSEDTFTQDWRVRLQPASLVSDLLKHQDSKAAGLKDSAGGIIDVVNNH